MTTRQGDRRAQIVAAALRLAAREGVALVTTRKIAQEADVNLATLHYFFGGKDALMLAALEDVTSTIIAELDASVQAGADLRAVLTESCAALWTLADDDLALPLVRCDLLLYLTRQPAHAAGARAQRYRYLASLESLYHGASDLCAEDDQSMMCHTLAGLVAGLADGLVIQCAGLDGTDSLRQTREHALRSILAAVTSGTLSGFDTATISCTDPLGER